MVVGAVRIIVATMVTFFNAIVHYCCTSAHSYVHAFVVCS